jgi:hypothetical protein
MNTIYKKAIIYKNMRNRDSDIVSYRANHRCEGQNCGDDRMQICTAVHSATVISCSIACNIATKLYSTSEDKKDTTSSGNVV